MSARDEHKARTRAAVVRAARAAFEERGFEGATIRAIAAAAGVATGTVLLHFGSKVELLVACWVDEVEQTLADSLATLPEGPVERRMAHLFRGFYAMYGARPELARVYLQQLLAVPVERSGPYDEVTARFVDHLAAMLAAEPLRPEVDPQTTALAVFGLYLVLLADTLRRPVEPALAAEALEVRIGALLRPMRTEGRAAG